MSEEQFTFERSNVQPTDIPEQVGLEDTRYSRRTFLALSAGAGVAATLPGRVAAEPVSGLYEFAVEQTPADYELPTLVHLDDEEGLAEIQEVEPDIVTTTTPEVAAYGQFTETQVTEVAEIESVTRLELSFGSNPFWRLGYYPDGVFPAPEDSVEMTSHEQTVDGLHSSSRGTRTG